MQVHKGKWGAGGDVWSTEGSLNGWKRFVFIPPWKNIFDMAIHDNLGKSVIFDLGIQT